MNQSVDINALYRELFGRAPDQQGADYWQGQLPNLIAQGGENKVREAMIGGAAQPDAQYYNNRNTSEADWADYTNRAQQQMAGLDSMPGVFSDYGSLAGITPQQSQAMMYRSPSDLQSIVDAFKSLYGVGTIEALNTDGIIKSKK